MNGTEILHPFAQPTILSDVNIHICRTRCPLESVKRNGETLMTPKVPTSSQRTYWWLLCAAGAASKHDCRCNNATNGHSVPIIMDICKFGHYRCTERKSWGRYMRC